MHIDIHHIALRTSDVAGLTAFYAAVLDVPVARRDGGRAAWLEGAGGTILMIERRAPDEPAPPRGSLELIAFAMDPADRDATRARLATLRIAIEDETPYTMYFRDPEGRRIGFSSYGRERDGSPDAARATRARGP